MLNFGSVLWVMEAMGANIVSGESVAVCVEYLDGIERVKEDSLGSCGCVLPLDYGLVAEVAGDCFLFHFAGAYQ